MTRRLAALAALCLVATLAIRAWLEWVGPLPGDRSAVGHIRHPDLTIGVRILSDLCSLVAFAPIAAITVYVAWRRVSQHVSREAAWLTVLASAVPVLSTSMKIVFGPVPLDADAFPAATVSSFPSGHAAYTTSLFGWLALLSWRAGRRGPVAACIGLIVVMGPMRVIGGLHLPSDVYGGYLLGIGWLAMTLAVKRHRHDRSR